MLFFFFGLEYSLCKMLKKYTELGHQLNVHTIMSGGNHFKVTYSPNIYWC